MARRRRAFFRTPSSLLASPEEAQQKLREAQQRKPEAGQRNPERYQRKTLPRIGPFQWVTTIRRKNPLLPASPGAAPRGGAFGDRTTLSVISDNRKKKSRSYRVGCCGEGIGSMAEVADGAIKASWPGLSRPSPKAQRIYAGKREKPCDRPPSCRSRRGGTRSCGGPAWMAGTSPAMTARVRRTNSKPVDQQITP